MTDESTTNTCRSCMQQEATPVLNERMDVCQECPDCGVFVLTEPTLPEAYQAWQSWNTELQEGLTRQRRARLARNAFLVSHGIPYNSFKESETASECEEKAEGCVSLFQQLDVDEFQVEIAVLHYVALQTQLGLMELCVNAQIHAVQIVCAITGEKADESLFEDCGVTPED